MVMNIQRKKQTNKQKTTLVIKTSNHLFFIVAKGILSPFAMVVKSQFQTLTTKKKCHQSTTVMAWYGTRRHFLYVLSPKELCKVLKQLL